MFSPFLLIHSKKCGDGFFLWQVYFQQLHLLVIIAKQRQCRCDKSRQNRGFKTSERPAQLLNGDVM